MKATFKVLLVVVVLAGSALAVQKLVKRSTYVDANYGFSMETPRFPGATRTTPGTVFFAAGPPAEGFAPNVNVTVQATRTTLQAYLDSSLGQFKQLNLKLNSERRLKVSGLDAVELEYQGKVGEIRELRFLSLSVIDKDRVILVTYAATPEGFPKLESEFRASLASFKLP